MSAKAKWLWCVVGVVVLVYPVVMSNAADSVTREQRGEDYCKPSPPGRRGGFTGTPSGNAGIVSLKRK